MIKILFIFITTIEIITLDRNNAFVTSHLVNLRREKTKQVIRKKKKNTFLTPNGVKLNLNLGQKLNRSK
jgi:hypothetical protein